MLCQQEGARFGGGDLGSLVLHNGEGLQVEGQSVRIAMLLLAELTERIETARSIQRIGGQTLINVKSLPIVFLSYSQITTVIGYTAKIVEAYR